jgi:hypothetical protein
MPQPAPVPDETRDLDAAPFASAVLPHDHHRHEANEMNVSLEQNSRTFYNNLELTVTVERFSSGQKVVCRQWPSGDISSVPNRALEIHRRLQ